MAAKLSLLSLTQLQQLAQSEPMSNHQHQPGYGHGQWAWRSKVRAPEESDDSWEVKAFAEDYTGSVSGSTWPPRSYTCSFCKREFRSAQALGGHMNVHRRDRATKQLHHYLPSPATAAATSSCTLVTPDRELQNFNGGFCLLYQLPPQSNAAVPGSQFPMPATCNFPAKHGSSNGSSHVYSTKTEVSSARTSNCLDVGNIHGNWNRDSRVEDLDLELRLGNRPFQS